MGAVSDGRTDVLSQTDLYVSHDLKFSGDRKLRLELTVTNLFNQQAAISKYSTYQKVDGVNFDRGRLLQPQAELRSADPGAGDRAGSAVPAEQRVPDSDSGPLRREVPLLVPASPETRYRLPPRGPSWSAGRFSFGRRSHMRFLTPLLVTLLFLAATPAIAQPPPRHQSGRRARDSCITTAPGI